MLKLYTDKTYLLPGIPHTILLFPFMGNALSDEDNPDKGRFEAFCGEAHDFLQLVEMPGEADVFVFPFDIGYLKKNLALVHSFQQVAHSYGKKLLVFYNNDDADPIHLEHAIIFRTSFYKSSRYPNEYALPGWSADFLESYAGGQLQDRPKEQKPTVGYCGYIDYTNPVSRIAKAVRRRLVKLQQKRGHESESGSALRGKVIRLLKNAESVNTNFIIRDGFWGGNSGSSGNKVALRREFAANILGSDYALAARGAGNFSYRLYEVVSCGRIPLFINTDCVLPYEEVIDWKKKFIWIEDKQVDEVESRIRAFHDSLDASEYLYRQHEMRKLYEEWLSPSGFFKNIHRYIRGSIQ